MQKLIAKYGLAAHLALLATAPLFLFPFCSASFSAATLLWLSLLAVCWLLLEPSVRVDEHLHTARSRVRAALGHDPLLWILLALTLLVGIRALNDGIALAYDAEAAVWRMKKPVLSLLPGCVRGAGILPFSAVVSASVLVLAGRHALGKSARTAFLALSSFLAGSAGVILLAVLGCSQGSELSALLQLAQQPSPMGLVFGLYLWAGSVSMVTAFERRWYRMVPCFLVALAGTSAAMFAFSPAFSTVVILGFGLLLLTYGFVYACFALKGSGNFRLLAVIGISLTLGGLLVLVSLPESAFAERLAPFQTGEFFTQFLGEGRRILDAVSIRMWLSNLWLGTGLGSFLEAFRFSIEEADWVALPKAVVSASCGWMSILAERGLVGVLMCLLPFGFLVIWHALRLIRWLSTRVLPDPACWLGTAVAVAIAVTGFFDCSVLRPEVVMATGALLSVAAATFPVRRENG